MTPTEEIAAVKQAQWRIEQAAELLGHIELGRAPKTVRAAHFEMIETARALDSCAMNMLDRMNALPIEQQ